MTIVLYRNEIEQRLRVHIKRHHEEERIREGVVTGYLEIYLTMCLKSIEN